MTISPRDEPPLMVWLRLIIRSGEGFAIGGVRASELVERAVVAEKVALSSKWKERPDVAKMIARVRKSTQQQREGFRDAINAYKQFSGETCHHSESTRRSNKRDRDEHNRDRHYVKVVSSRFTCLKKRQRGWGRSIVRRE